MHSEKVFCSNCRNCVVIQRPAVISDQYLLRIHCAKDKWRKKIGEVKYYKYFTAARRTVESCDSYEPMGHDVRDFVREFRKSLPIKDEVYSHNVKDDDGQGR